MPKSVSKDITLPNFLGIGIQKAGTTWLYDVLQSHSEVFLPQEKKEVHFFDTHYSKGLNWYTQFFKNTQKYKIVGEITPKYIFEENCLKRIKKDLDSKTKFIVILRDPVQRFISSYNYAKQNHNFKGPIKDFHKQNVQAFQRGLYFEQLTRWYKKYPKKQFLVLYFEEDIIKHPQKALEKLAKFLQIDPKKFNSSVLQSKSNASYTIRYNWLYSKGIKFAKFLRAKNLDYVVNKVKDSNMLFMFKSKAKKEEIDSNFKKMLYKKYKQDIENLEKLMKKDLSMWKKHEK